MKTAAKDAGPYPGEIAMANFKAVTNSEQARSADQTLRIYLKEAKYEFLKNLRIPRYSLSVIFFPLMFYILFGLVMGRQTVGGVNIAAYLIGTYGVFGVMGASLFGTASGLAAERGLGWLEVKRASPMPPFAYFVAKVVMSTIFSSAVVLLLLAMGIAFGGVRLPLAQTVRLVTTLVAGSLPFCAMGLALGYFIGPNSAPAFINLFYLPLSFCSGLWVPFIFLPKAVRQIAQFLPPYHLAQLALEAIGAGQHQSNWMHWEVLLGFTLICLGIARLGFQRDENKLYG
ncbi:MAG TPA: ABC transporter permease [Terriglobales bacterium]|nr:ABC transporter permease [Terriglobales bacterium]